ncbi:MAG TPA: hypothetical protein VGQ37_14075 [Vicinamibacterales bacterium]|nr:hypothetical protein [Vicinamibacterales bacterium]
MDRPVLVVAAKDENSMKLLVPEYWEKRGSLHPSSVLVTGPDRHYIALQADAKAQDTDAINPYYLAYWSYASLLIDASFEGDLPLWLRDGLAGVLSNTIVRENEIRFGMAPPWYIRTVSTQSRLRLPQLFTTTRDSSYYQNPATRDQFDAQTWALLHYLLFDPVIGKSGKLDVAIQAIASGTPSADAMRQAYGDFEPLEGAYTYMLHVRKELLPYSRLKTETRIAASAFSSRVLSDGDSANARAALHTAMGRPVEARALIVEARKGGESAAGYEVEALLAARDDDAAALKTALSKAEQFGTTNFYALYRLAVLEMPQDGNAAASAVAEARLRKAVELNAFHAGAHATLANVLASGPAEKRAQAIPIAQTAVKLAPRDSFVHAALARSLWNVGERDAALARARLAVTLAQNDAQRRQAQQMVDFFVKNAPAR